MCPQSGQVSWNATELSRPQLDSNPGNISTAVQHLDIQSKFALAIGSIPLSPPCGLVWYHLSLQSVIYESFPSGQTPTSRLHPGQLHKGGENPDGIRQVIKLIQQVINKPYKFCQAFVHSIQYEVLHHPTILQLA